MALWQVAILSQESCTKRERNYSDELRHLAAADKISTDRNCNNSDEIILLTEHSTACHVGFFILE